MSFVSALQEYQNFFFFKFVDNGTIEKQLQEYKACCAHLAANKYTIDDWKFAAHILLALPPSYDHICDHYIDNKDPSTFDQEEVITCILNRERCLKGEAAQSAANAITRGPAPKSSNPPNNNNKKKSKQPLDSQPCHNCGKTGHWVRECRSKKKQSNAGLSNLGQCNNQPLLNVVETSDAKSDSPMICYFGAPENWLMDSGATNHMTPFGSDFIVSSYAKFVESQTVVLSDGSSRCKILGKGTIERWVETSPHHYRQLLLNDVLHVDGIKQ